MSWMNRQDRTLFLYNKFFVCLLDVVGAGKKIFMVDQIVTDRSMTTDKCMYTYRPEKQLY